MKKIAFLLILASLAGTLSCNRNDLYDNTQNEGESLLLSTLDEGLTVDIQSPVSGSTNSPIPITIVFKSPVTDFDATDIIAGNGTVGGFAGAGDTYTAVITPLVDGDVTVDIPAGAAQDAEGNLSKAARRFTAVYDTVVGLTSVTIASNNPDNSLAILGNRVILSFTAGEPLNNPGVVINGVAATVTGGPNNWTAYRIMNAGDPEVAVTFTISGIQDLAGNVTADVSATTDTSSVTLDMSMPSLNPVSIASSNPFVPMTIAGDTVTLAFTANEDIQTPSVTIAGGAATLAGGPAAWTATRVLPGSVPGGVVAFSISYRDLAGNVPPNVTATTDLSYVDVDVIDPTIVSITSAPASGTFGTGMTVDVTLNFSENVILAGGTLDVTLDSGGVVSIAPFGPSMTATGTYTVGAGESSPDLNVTSVAPGIGATLRDEPGNNASLALPAGNNLADNSTIVIDTVPPAIVDIDSGTGDGTFGTGAAIDVTVNFSKNVTLAGNTMTLNLNSGGTVTIAPFGPAMSASGTYTVAAGHTSIDLDVTTLTLEVGATLRDAMNNDASTVIPPGDNLADNRAIVIDTAVPYIVSITSTPSTGTFGTGAAINVTVNFSDNMTLAGNNMNLILDSGGTVTIAPFGPSSNAMGTYIVAAGETSGDLTVTNITLDAGATLRDNLNNDASTALPVGANLADNSAVIIDAVAPVITGITSATDDSNPHGLGSNIDVRLMFSKDVTLAVGTLEVTLDTGVTVSINPFGPAMSTNATYIVGAGEESGDLNVTGVALAGGGTLRDDYNNDADLSLPGANNLADNKALVVDGVAPVVTAVTIASDNADPERAMIGDIITVTVTVNEDLQAPTATIGGNAAGIGGGPLVWTASYTLGAMVDGAATFQISNVRDLAGNTIADIVAVTDTSSVTVDNTPPGVTPVSISSSNADPTLAMLGDTVTVTFTSDEPLQAPTATICGVGAIIGGGPLVWTAEHDMTITDAEGGVPFQISNLRDLTGNTIGNISLVTDGSSVTYDRTLPTITPVSITSSNANPAYATTGNQITVTLQSDEDLQAPTATVEGNPALVAGGAQIWTATYTMQALDPEGPVIFSFTNVRDLAGNTLAGPINATTDMSAVTHYNTAPSLNPVHITSSNPNPSWAREGNIVTLTFTANREIQTPTVMIEGAIVVPGGGPTVWAAARTMNLGDTDGPVDFTISNIRDMAGNTAVDVSSTTDFSTVTFDKTPPTIFTAETMDADGNGRIDHYRLTFNEDVTDSTFPGYVLNGQGSMQNQWFVTGYDNPVLVHGTEAPEPDTINDDVIYLRFSEVAGISDTDATPDLTSSATPLLTDRAGNPMNIVGSAAVTEADGAAPVVVSVVGAPGSTSAIVTFSEAVDTNNADGGACTSGVMQGNLDYFNNSGGDASSLIGMNDTDGCDGQVEVITNANIAAADLEVDTIGPKMTQIYDSANIAALTNVKQINGFLGKLVCRFDTTSSGADVNGDVSDFPLLIRLNDPAIIDAVQPGAPDIRFIDRDGTSLKYHVERWDQGLDLAEVWVLVPQVDGNNTSDYITMYYNDVIDGTIPDGQDQWGVFDTVNGFAGVWHLANAGFPLTDSTINGNDGTPSFSPSITGIIGMGRNISGSGSPGYISVPYDISLDIVGQITLSAWIKPDDGESASFWKIISRKQLIMDPNGYDLDINTMDEQLRVFGGWAGGQWGESDLDNYSLDIDTTWHHIAATINGTTATLYFDGIDRTDNMMVDEVFSAGRELVIGATSVDHSNNFDGIIDEARVESMARSPEWVKLCYENQRMSQRLVNFWLDEGWQFRMKITATSGKIAGNLSDFPVYVSLENLGTNFFNSVRPDGGDIVVTAADGRTILPREIVTINAGARTGELWFRAPNLIFGENTTFCVYYGNPSASIPNDTVVWSNGYAGVWHLNGNGFDSSPFGNHGAVNGAPVATAGQMGNAIHFDGGNDYLDISSSPSLALANTVTISAWFKPALGTEPEMPIISKRFNAGAFNGYEITVDPSQGDLFTYTQSGSYGQADMAQLEISTVWYNYYTAVITPGAPAISLIYFNGLDRSTDTVIALLLADATPLNIGRMPDDSVYFSGDIDEVRISSVARTSEWILTEFNNQSDPWTFFDYGAEEFVGP